MNIFSLILPVKTTMTLFVMAVLFTFPAQAIERINKNVTYNVFAVVSESIESAFHYAAERLEIEEDIRSFPLDGFQVHCTLYMTQYPPDVLDNILSRVETMAAHKRIFEIESTGLELTSSNWFFMNISKNSDLQTLSDAMVLLLSQLRTKSDYVPKWALEYPAKLEYIKRYGSPNVYKEFNPHLTFLAYGDELKLKRFMKKNRVKFYSRPVKGHVIGIGVGEADKSGQVKKPIKIFPFRD